MELTIGNAQTIFALPVSVLGPYLPRVFDRFRNSETDGHWVAADELIATVEPQCQVPEMAISGPTALLSLLTVLASRGLLDQIPSWTALPEACAPETDIQQVRQITSTAVIEKTLSVTFKRVVAQEENCSTHVANAPRAARADYCHVSELAAALVAFDDASRGQWRWVMPPRCRTVFMTTELHLASLTHR